MFVENLKKQARDKISGNIDKNYLKSKKQKKNTIPHKEKETDINQKDGQLDSWIVKQLNSWIVG